MDEQQLIELGERLEAAFNTSDWATYSAAMTNNTLLESPRIQARGPEEIIQYVRGVKEAYPDIRATATNVLACGNTLVRELTWEGTHAGPMKTPQGTIPPTNRRITFKGVVLLEASNDGKVVALREYYDRAAIMAQLGIGAPAPAPTS
jgi:predicted ester cyclase